MHLIVAKKNVVSCIASFLIRFNFTCSLTLVGRLLKQWRSRFLVSKTQDKYKLWVQVKLLELKTVIGKQLTLPKDFTVLSHGYGQGARVEQKQFMLQQTNLNQKAALLISLISWYNKVHYESMSIWVLNSNDPHRLIKSYRYAIKHCDSYFEV